MALAACSSSVDSAAPATTASATTAAAAGVVAGYSADETSPLVITPAGPAPIPVAGTDGKVHLAYELEVLNFSPRPATLTKLETLVGGPDGTVVATVEGAELAGQTLLVAGTATDPPAVIPPGRTLLILAAAAYDTPADVPATFSHRLSATLGPAAPDAQGPWIFPEGAVTQFSASMAINNQAPIVIGPPLAGDGWVAAAGCCAPGAHRGAMLPIGGRINATERYALDWVKLDNPGGAQSLEALNTYRGDAARNEDYLAYGEPLLAVADGTVVTVVSNMPDVAPEAPPVGLSIPEMAGNLVSIDIGGGVFAHYAHLVPDSPTVKVGDRVTRGQVIGVLGNSGNSQRAHLHFQLSDSPRPMIGDNLPYLIDTITVAGHWAVNPDATPPIAFQPESDPGPHSNLLPLYLSVTSFPNVS